jgi:hypothetical protein
MAGLIPPGYVPPSGFSGNISLKINSASLMIYYNNSLVKTVVPVTLSNFAIIINIPTSNTGSSSLPFSVKQFIGNLEFNNIQLLTSATNVYKFVLALDIGIVQGDTGVIEYAAVIANMTTANTSSINECTIVSLGQHSVNLGTSISGQ